MSSVGRPRRRSVSQTGVELQITEEEHHRNAWRDRRIKPGADYQKSRAVVVHRRMRGGFTPPENPEK